MNAWDRFEVKLEGKGGQRTHAPAPIDLTTYQVEAATTAARGPLSRAAAILRDAAGPNVPPVTKNAAANIATAILANATREQVTS